MKRITRYFFIMLTTSVVLSGCKRSDDYFPGTPSQFISNFDLRKLYRNTDKPLHAQELGGASFVKGVVISDFRNGNSPAGLLIVQNSRMAGGGIDSVRGLAFNIGAEALKYIPGDSVHIKIDGGILTRVGGTLQVVGLSGALVSKISGGRVIKPRVVTISQVVSTPDIYESSMITIASSLLVPEPAPGETFTGDKTIDDGTGTAIVHTEATAGFASKLLLPSGTFTGIPFIAGADNKKLTLWMRSADDFIFAPLPKLSPVIITGCFGNPNGTDGNYEYIQLLATRDIDFSKTPFSVVTANNAGATTFPTLGWATGGIRTYKFNLTSGTVSKGGYFYVGGTGKRINGYPSGAPSTDISSAKWIATTDYTKVTGADGIGSITTNLLANSGNLAGIAVFDGTKLDVSTLPLDVIFFGGTGGNFYSPGPPEIGYRVTNTEYYSVNNPTNGSPQPFVGAGTNTFRFGFANDSEFASFGGEYDAKSGRWNTKRTLKSLPVPQNAPISIIEGGTKLVN